MRTWMVALGLCGCGFSSTSSNLPDDADPEHDGGGAEGQVQPVCFGTFLEVCIEPPASARTLMAQRIDTSSSPLCETYTAKPSIDACVITGQSIVIPANNTVRVTGKRPLILMATSTVTISGVLDAASHGQEPGPAADTAPCQLTAATAPLADTLAGGGGWGGSFGTAGGSGGTGANNGTGGMAPGPVAATTLTGGCAGGKGANNRFGTNGGAGGHGGGAVLILAPQRITIEGTVNASGGGGAGGVGFRSFGEIGSGGGGGGGSGGMIVLEAAAVDVPGKCFANGGGGGEGSGVPDGNDGGEASAPNADGAGAKAGSMTGGDGGNSALGSTAGAPGKDGTPGDIFSGDGGGGGGGGGGIILVRTPQASKTDDPKHVSPPPS